MNAEINPVNLKIARERLNFSLDDAAKKIGISNPEFLRLAEKGDRNITFKQLKKAAKVYDLSMGYFYLDTLPIEDIPVTDFRMNPDYYKRDKSPVLSLALYQAIRQRNLIVDIHKSIDTDIPIFDLSCSLKDDVESVGDSLRKIFDDYCFANKAEVIKRVIHSLEGIGVYVAQVGGQKHSKVDYEEFDGAAIYFNILPVILLNADNKTDTKMLFTIFHELAHLTLKNSAITNYSVGSNSDNIPPDISKIETFCNKVAAAALLPTQEVSSLFNGENISEISTKYRVSRAVVAIRLKNLNLISQKLCDELLKKYEQEYKRNKRNMLPRKPTPINPNIIKKRNLGSMYIDAIREAISNNYINYYEALKSLGMKDKAAKKALYGE